MRNPTVHRTDRPSARAIVTALPERHHAERSAGVATDLVEGITALSAIARDLENVARRHADEPGVSNELGALAAGTRRAVSQLVAMASEPPPTMRARAVHPAGSARPLL